MGERSGAGVAPGVKVVGRRIEHWRRVRVKRSPMPEELWEAATELARVHGTSAVARELRLGYESLRERVERVVHSGGRGNSGHFPGRCGT
jgi:hypothetical protein